MCSGCAGCSKSVASSSTSQGNRGRNEGFTDTSVRGHLYFGKGAEGRVCNGLMSFFEPHDPLVGAALERACAPTSSVGPTVAYGTSRARA